MGIPANVERLPVVHSVAIGPDASDQPVLRAAISGTGADIAIVAADTVGKIRLRSLFLTVKTTAVDITLESLTGATHTALSGAMTPIANTLWPFPWDPAGHVESKAGESLNLHQNGTSQISGFATYQIVDATND